MYNVSDIFFDHSISFETKRAILELMERENISYDIQVLQPTESNNDVNGSQHHAELSIDFTYEDATSADVREATSLGYYEYFGQYGFDTYTGHYYNGSDDKFAAIVIDPPAYAATVQI